jgi:orotate phosphoribosyltransferase
LLRTSRGDTMAYLAAAMSRHPVQSTHSTARAQAFNLIKDKSFSKGRFTLASGNVTDYYLDLKPTMFDPEGARLLADLILSRLEEVRVDLIGGLAIGAVPLVSHVLLRSASTNRPIAGFFVRKSVKDHGTKKLIEGTNDIAGKTVVILDDVTTTGESAMEAAEAARKAGATVALVLSVVDRQEGAMEFFQDRGIPFAWLFTASEFMRA